MILSLLTSNDPLCLYFCLVYGKPEESTVGFFFFFLRNGIEVSNFEKRTFHSIMLYNSSKIQFLGTNYIKLKMIIVSFL